MKTFQEMYEALDKKYELKDFQYKKEFPTLFKMLTFIILTQQCTDERAREVAKDLFAKYPTVELLANANRQAVENLLKPAGLHQKKATAIIENAKTLQQFQKYRKPLTVRDLLSLKMVGEKTVSVVLHEIYGRDSFPVDTHILRVFSRLYGEEMTAKRVHHAVTISTGSKIWFKFHRLLIQHGRETCTSRLAACTLCPLTDSCEYFRKYKNGGK